MKNPILLCLATQKGFEVLRGLRAKFPDQPFFVTTFQETNVGNSYAEKITRYCEKNGISVVQWTHISRDMVAWAKKTQVHSIVCVSWNRLISPVLIEELNGRVVVAHDSLLPRYRGFAPLPNAMINGDLETGVTVLLAAEKWMPAIFSSKKA